MRLDEESPVKSLRKSLNVDGWPRDCLTKDETAAATVNQLRSRVPQAAEKSFLAMVISSEAIERGFNVKYWRLSELIEELSKAEKKSEVLKKIKKRICSPSVTSVWGP